jgi:hypothetical protein
MHLTDSEVDAACHYIRSQMETHSWWPKEAPGEAKREFELMCGTALSLNVWCERWLDAGQCKKLEKEVNG